MSGDILSVQNMHKYLISLDHKYLIMLCTQVFSEKFYEGKSGSNKIRDTPYIGYDRVYDPNLTEEQKLNDIEKILEEREDDNYFVSKPINSFLECCIRTVISVLRKYIIGKNMNDSNNVSYIKSTVWIILRQFGLRLMYMENLVRILLIIVNGLIRPKYMVVSCKEKQCLYDKDNLTNEKCLRSHIYTCGRAITENFNEEYDEYKESKIIIYDTVSSDEDYMDQESLLMRMTKTGGAISDSNYWKHKYQKYKHKYIELRKNTNK